MGWVKNLRIRGWTKGFSSPSWSSVPIKDCSYVLHRRVSDSKLQQLLCFLVFLIFQAILKICTDTTLFQCPKYQLNLLLKDHDLLNHVFIKKWSLSYLMKIALCKLAKKRTISFCFFFCQDFQMCSNISALHAFL